MTEIIGGQHTKVLLEHPYNFIFFMIFLFTMLAVLGLASLTWGLTALIGVTFIGIGFIIILLGRGESLNPWIFLICIIFGVAFIFLSYIGVELAVVDLRIIPGIEYLHNIVN